MRERGKEEKRKSKCEENNNYPFILEARRVNASVTLKFSFALVLMWGIPCSDNGG